MKKLHAFNILDHPRMATILAFAGVLFLFSSNVSAQPEFSASELRLIKERRYSSDMMQYRFPKDELQTPDKPFSPSRPAFADGNLDPTFNASVTEGFGYVHETVIQPDGKIIAAGIFHRTNGTRTNGIARFNADGTLDANFNVGTGANAVIRTVALQADGKIIIAGSFTTFNGQTVRRIVRLNSDGSIDATFSTIVNFTNQIEDITLQPDGKILVGGIFTVSSSKLVRLNSDGTLDIAFSGFTSAVRKIVYTASGKILVGGDSGAAGRPITRINSDGTADGSFNPGSTPGSSVWEIVVQSDGKIVLGGGFDNFNGTPTDAIARINDNGSFDTAFDYLTGTPSFLAVDALVAQPDGKILASYYFEDNTGNFSRVARFNSNATIDATFTTGNAEAFLIADINLLGDGKMLVGGAFISYNNQTRLRLIKLNSDGTLDNAFNPSVSVMGIVYAIKRQADGKMIIGGDFDYVNGIRKGGIARLNPDGTLDNGFNIGTGFNGNVYALAIQTDGKIIAGGDFLGYDNNFTYALARLNSNGSFDLNMGFGTTEVVIFFVYSLGLQSDGKILVGGSIFNPQGGSQTTLARVNTNGSPDTTFTSLSLSSGGTTRAILVKPDDKIIIGGTFFSSTSVPRNGIARLNANGTLDSGFNVNIGQVYALAQQADGQVLAGGALLRRLAAADGAVDATFITGGGPNNLVRAIAVQPGGKILIGGSFDTYAGLNANRIARVNNNGSLDEQFDTGGAVQSGGVVSLALQNDGKIVVGGQFLDFNFIEKFSIVRLQNTVSVIRAPFDFDGDGKTDVSIYRPSVGEWWYLRSSNNQNYAAQFGNSSDRIAPADFTGDGKTDIAFFRPSTGEWFVLRSEDSSYYSFPFGTNGDVPAPADYDGDTKADAAVFRPSTSVWYISLSAGGTTIQQFGQTGDAPVVADYDGDGRADIAIYRVALGEWWIQRSSAGTIAFQFGNSADKPVQGDYTGDGKSDVAIWRGSTGEWFVLRSEDQSYYSFPFGTTGDKPTPGDYDGDGKADAAVFRSSDTNWYLQRSTAGFSVVHFGFSTDKPVPEAFIP
jgi:uncharacterized delta-60 repeat protein